MQKTIEATPTWAAVLPILLMGLEGDEVARKAAHSELRRMAEAADKWNAAQQQEVQPWDYPFFSHDTEGGTEFHKTEAEAIKWCEEALQVYREESGDGWAEEVESISWGVVIGRAVKCNAVPLPDHHEFFETCDYELKSVARPSTQGLELDSKLREEAKSAAMLLCADAAALCGNQIQEGCARCDAVAALAAHHDFSRDEFNNLFVNANLGKKDSYNPKFFSINVLDEVAAQAKDDGA